MHSLLQFVLNLQQLRLSPFAHRLSKYGKISLSGLATNMRKAKKVESHRFSLSTLGTVLSHKMAELDQACFVMDVACRQIKARKALLQQSAASLIVANPDLATDEAKALLVQQLQVSIADRFRVYVKVCHYPPGASKWNPIEHRMFCFISNNWAAHPLTDYETVLKFIRTTKTCAGLKIRAALHTKQYQRGIRISDSQMREFNLKHFTQRPNWNYSISPSKNVN